MMSLCNGGRRDRGYRRALLVWLLLAFSMSAQAQTVLKIRLGIVTVSAQMALYIAATQGMFAKRGFDVKVVPLTSGVQANQALAADQVDWSAGGVETTITAASTGLPLRPYAMYAKGGDSLGILVRKDANIHDARDLIGKRVAVVSGTGSAQGLDSYLQANGIQNNQVQRVNTTFGAMGQMLVSGAVPAMVGLEPFLTVTREQFGDQAVLLTRFGKYVQGGGFFLISDKWADAHPDRIEAAVEALADAQQFVRSHPRQAAAIEAGFIKADPDIIERSSAAFQFTPEIDGFTISSLEKTSKYLADAKVIDKPVSVSTMLMPAQKIIGELQQRRPDLLK
jgi:ABC-type nitrate/sulfonate/bicarbonate transport system substrate-binding protein